MTHRDGIHGLDSFRDCTVPATGCWCRRSRRSGNAGRISNWKEQVELSLVISWLVSLFGNDGLTKLVVRPKIIQGLGTQQNSSIGKLSGIWYTELWKVN